MKLTRTCLRELRPGSVLSFHVKRLSLSSCPFRSRRGASSVRLSYCSALVCANDSLERGEEENRADNPDERPPHPGARRAERRRSARPCRHARGDRFLLQDRSGTLSVGCLLRPADWLRSREKRVFADLKLYDVPQTVGAAVRQLRRRDVDFLTVHGNDAILRAACDAARGTPASSRSPCSRALTGRTWKISASRPTFRRLYAPERARAQAIGCAGVISSGHEAARIRAVVSDGFRIVVPGIRAASQAGHDDQKRTVDVETAFEAGADYIVMGRPIRNAPDRWRPLPPSRIGLRLILRGTDEAPVARGAATRAARNPPYYKALWATAVPIRTRARPPVRNPKLLAP